MTVQVAAGYMAMGNMATGYMATAQYMATTLFLQCQQRIAQLRVSIAVEALYSRVSLKHFCPEAMREETV
jgi:hypothetical protein